MCCTSFELPSIKQNVLICNPKKSNSFFERQFDEGARRVCVQKVIGSGARPNPIRELVTFGVAEINNVIEIS